MDFNCDIQNFIGTYLVFDGEAKEVKPCLMEEIDDFLDETEQELTEKIDLNSMDTKRIHEYIGMQVANLYNDTDNKYFEECELPKSKKGSPLVACTSCTFKITDAKEMTQHQATFHKHMPSGYKHLTSSQCPKTPMQFEDMSMFSFETIIERSDYSDKFYDDTYGYSAYENEQCSFLD